MKRNIFAVAVILAVSVCSSGVFASELRIGAGTTASNSVLKPVEEPFEKATGIDLTTFTYGSKAAIKALDAGTIDAAMAAHTMDELIDLLKKDGYEVSGDAAYQEVTIEEPKSYKIVIHKDNPVSALTAAQIKELFAGKIENWKDVGGKDAPVIVIWGSLLEASNKTFSDQILEKEPLTKDHLEVKTAEDVKQSVATLPEAVGYLPSSLIDASVKSPESTVVKTKPINVFAKGKISPDLQKLIDFIKGEGQKHIKK
ncbi:MAG: substrate-binding domain-containing protein [Nitrospirae bacterium]|nr:substrate-binding domain-containing protein [Nitrospirota bacterium]